MFNALVHLLGGMVSAQAGAPACAAAQQPPQATSRPAALGSTTQQPSAEPAERDDTRQLPDAGWLHESPPTSHSGSPTRFTAARSPSDALCAATADGAGATLACQGTAHAQDKGQMQGGAQQQQPVSEQLTSPTGWQEEQQLQQQHVGEEQQPPLPTPQQPQLQLQLQEQPAHGEQLQLAAVQLPQQELDGIYDRIAAALQQLSDTGCCITGSQLCQAGITIMAAAAGMTPSAAGPTSPTDSAGKRQRERRYVCWPGRSMEPVLLWQYGTVARRLLSVAGTEEVLGLQQRAEPDEERPSKRVCTSARTPAAAPTAASAPGQAAGSSVSSPEAAAAAPALFPGVRSAAKAAEAKIRQSSLGRSRSTSVPCVGPPDAASHQQAAAGGGGEGAAGAAAAAGAGGAGTAAEEAGAAAASAEQPDTVWLAAEMATAVQQLEAAHATTTQALAVLEQQQQQQQQQQQHDQAAPELPDAGLVGAFLDLLQQLRDRLGAYMSTIHSPPEGLQGSAAVLSLWDDLRDAPAAVQGCLQDNEPLLQQLRAATSLPPPPPPPDAAAAAGATAAAAGAGEAAQQAGVGGDAGRRGRRQPPPAAGGRQAKHAAWLRKQQAAWLDEVPEVGAADIPVMLRPRLAGKIAQLKAQRAAAAAAAGTSAAAAGGGGAAAVGPAAAAAAAADRVHRLKKRKLTARKWGWCGSSSRDLA